MVSITCKASTKKFSIYFCTSFLKEYAKISGGRIYTSPSGCGSVFELEKNSRRIYKERQQKLYV